MKSKTIDDQLTQGTTLVVGGTGKTGRRVAQRLQQRGVSVRIASRSVTPAFDWNDRSTWDGVLDGVTAAYITYAPDLALPGATDTVRAFVECAVKNGIGRVVLLSGRGEAEAQRCEQVIRDSGIEWTVVRASWFNQNFSEGEFLEMVLHGAITLPAKEIPEPFVDADDIADVVVAALTEDGHTGEVYEVTGPRLMTFTQVAHEISRASGREITFVPISKDQFAHAVSASGAPEAFVWLLSYLFDTVLDGRNAQLCDGIQRALGRAPTDFSEYANRAAASGIWKTQATG
jgi:uncharacterized protein YbjT (DUF2867 family)